MSTLLTCLQVVCTIKDSDTVKMHRRGFDLTALFLSMISGLQNNFGIRFSFFLYFRAVKQLIVINHIQNLIYVLLIE